LRIVYMLAMSHAINSPGLSGFASSGFLSQVLARTDIFLIWSMVLLVIGYSIADGLPRGKAILGVVTVMLILLAAQAGVGTMLSGLGTAAVQRPF